MSKALVTTRAEVRKTIARLLLYLLAASPSPAQAHYTEKQVIDYTKAVDVQTLDPSLPSQRLEDWLQSGPPHARIQWDVADTCDNKPAGDEDYPLCAKIWFSRNGQAGSFLIEVGTRHKGISGRPQLYNPIIGWEDGPCWVMTDDVDRLSHLPSLLDQPAYAMNVSKLYGEIVAHHPTGIPSDATMAALRPFLSKRLTEQLQAAKVCEADYLRQRRHATSATAKTAGLKNGLFTGDGNRAFPVSAWPVRKGQQKDGSFLVSVNLFAQTIDVGNGLKGGLASGGSWVVSVKVISEDGQFVVDDVRIFDGPSTDGPSRLLSNSLPICDGSHWTGQATF